MIDKSLVSVIVPAYNVDWCIGRALDSVFAQSFKQFELIVVNDGSTDDIGKVLATYGNSVRVLNQENEGMCNARNAGIRIARGDYVAFLDADDYWLPSKLDRQMELMHSQSEIGFCSTAARVEDEKGKCLNIWQCPQSDIDMLELLFVEKAAVAGGCSSVLVRKSILDNVGYFDESLNGFEDPDLWIRLAATSNYSCIEEPLVVILRREHSVSSNLEAMRASSLKSIRKNRTLLSPELQGAFWRASLAGVYTDYAKGAYRGGDRSAALADTLKALVLSPIGRGRLCLALLRDFLLGRSL